MTTAGAQRLSARVMLRNTHHLELVVVLQPVRVLAVAAVLGPPRGLQASKTLKQVRSVWVQDFSATVDKSGKIATYRVNCKVSFEIKD